MEPNAASTLFVCVDLDGETYAIEARRIVEVLPLLAIRRLAHATPGIAGAIIYRGASAPVIDLADRILGCAAPARLGTRILMVGARDASLFGLIVPNATEILRLEPDDFKTAGVGNVSAPFLGLVAAGPHGLVRRVEIDALLAPFMTADIAETA